MAFNLADVLSGANVSNLDTKQERLEYISLSKLHADGNNFYSMDGLDELAASIELLGLQQPLRVRPAEEPGEYIIVSGHRRCAALRMLAEDGKTDFESVPCLIDGADESEAMRELRLIFANSSTRKLNSADLSKQAERVEALLYQLKEEGVEFPGRMRDHVAQACKVSASKLARLKVIREKLEPTAYKQYECGKLAESVAYELASLPADFQARLLTAIPKITIDQVFRARNLYSTGGRWEPECHCPDGKACTHADAFLRHDINSYSPCGGTKCCLECDRAYENYCACSSACAKAKANKKVVSEEKAQKAEEQRLKDQKKLRNAISKSAQRITVAAKAAGVDGKTEIQANIGYKKYKLSKIQSYANEDFGEDYLYSNEFDFTRTEVARAAKTLCCSADYLCGLSDELHPAAKSEEPDEWETDEDRYGFRMAKCKSCGDVRLEWDDRSHFCPNCGRPKIID